METLMRSSASCRMAVKSHGGVPRPAGQPLCVRLPARLVASQAVKTEEAPATTTTTQPQAPSNADDIYIGFAKGDYAPRAGRKGRFIKDDPKKYPAKESLGAFVGATGGWAGGEAALWSLREQIAKEKGSSSSSSAAAASSSSASKAKAAPKAPAPSAEDQAAIYLGFGKDELEVRKSGSPGRFILDNPKKYPAKEDIAFLKGATGGFAGGEKGLKQYVETGEVKLRDPNAPGRKQTSPVAIAGLILAAGAGGGLLLNGVTDLGENAVSSEILQAPIDDNTKYLLIAAVALLAGASVLGAAKAAVQSVEDRLAGAGEGAQKLIITGGFWLLVFVAARFVLEF